MACSPCSISPYCQMLIGFGKPLLTWVLNHMQEFLLFVRCGTVLWFCGKSSLLFCRCILKSTWRRKCQLTPVFLPGKSHGQRSLAGYSPCDCKESDMTECACTCACMHTHTHTHTHTHWRVQEWNLSRAVTGSISQDKNGMKMWQNLVIAGIHCVTLYCILKNFPLFKTGKLYLSKSS